MIKFRVLVEALDRHRVVRDEPVLEPVETRPLREQYLDGDLLAVGDIVVSIKHQTIHEVLMLGTNYLTVVDEHGTTSKMWITDAVNANILKEDFQVVRRKRSSKNQIAFVGYKTKHFTQEHYDAFHPLIKTPDDKFAVLTLIRATDQLLGELTHPSVENYRRIQSLFDQSGKLLERINNPDHHSYRSVINESITKLGKLIETL